MDIKIRINCDNAAFEGLGCGREIARILGRLSRAVRDSEAVELEGWNEALRDINGNVVGRVEAS